MKTLKQIQAKAKTQAKKVCKNNEILNISIKGDLTFGMVFVEMQSTCDMNNTMTWEFTYSYDGGDADFFTEYEKQKFAHLITKEKFDFKQV